MHHVTCQDLLTRQLSCGKWNSLTLPNFHQNLQLLLCSSSLLKALHLPCQPSEKSGGCHHFFSAPCSCSLPSPLLLGLCEDEQVTTSRSTQNNSQAAVVRKGIYFILSPGTVFALPTSSIPNNNKTPETTTK
mgnify:CR=1 FL=1